MEAASIFYCPPFEEEKSIESELIWKKDTIQYLINNKLHIIRIIRKLMNSYSESDIYEVYSNLIYYFSKAEDYSIEKAKERSQTGEIIPIDSYIIKCTKYIVNRFKADKYKRERMIKRNFIIDEEGEKKDIFDRIPDERAGNAFKNVEYDLETYLENIQYIRYKYEADIFLILYIRLITNDNDDLYKTILEVLGISKKKLREIENKASLDEDFKQLIKAISLRDKEEVIRRLEKYIYGVKQLKKAIKDLRNNVNYKNIQ